MFASSNPDKYACMEFLSNLFIVLKPAASMFIYLPDDVCVIEIKIYVPNYHNSQLFCFADKLLERLKI